MRYWGPGSVRMSGAGPGSRQQGIEPPPCHWYWDADGLNWLAQAPVIRDNWVLTPPPGEAARLLGCTIAEIEGTGLRPSRGCNSATAAWCCSRGRDAHPRRQGISCATRAIPAWPVAAWVTSYLV